MDSLGGIEKLQKLKILSNLNLEVMVIPGITKYLHVLRSMDYSNLILVQKT